jgi:DNA-binding transcriptional ArsR family regulator
MALSRRKDEVLLTASIVTPDFLSESALLLGEHARLKILWALLEGRAYTAGELALFANLSASSASMHLAKLLKAGWIDVTSRGRHRYYSIADETVACAVEAIGAIRFGNAEARNPKRPNPGSSMQRARSCYGHLAGEVAVAFWNALLEHDWMQRDGKRFILGERGVAGLSSLLQCSRDEAALKSSVKPCMDWTERMFHLGGGLGVRVFQALKDRGWINPMPRSRLVAFAPGRDQALVRLAFDDT